jgi:hypothetical protein
MQTISGILVGYASVSGDTALEDPSKLVTCFADHIWMIAEPLRAVQTKTEGHEILIPWPSSNLSPPSHNPRKINHF